MVFQERSNSDVTESASMPGSFLGCGKLQGRCLFQRQEGPGMKLRGPHLLPVIQVVANLSRVCSKYPSISAQMIRHLAEVL